MPNSFIAVLLIHGRLLFGGNPNSGAVVIIPKNYNLSKPDILSYGFYIKKEIIRAPPILCPYKNNGSKGLACFINTSISWCICLMLEHALAPPEYLNIKFI